MNTLTLPPLDLAGIEKIKQIARDTYATARTRRGTPQCPICKGYAGIAWSTGPDGFLDTEASRENFESHLDNNRECVIGRSEFWARMHGWEPIEKQIWLKAIGDAKVPLTPVPVHRGVDRDDPAYGRTDDYVFVPVWVTHLIKDHETGQIADMTPEELMRAIMSEISTP